MLPLMRHVNGGHCGTFPLGHGMVDHVCFFRMRGTSVLRMMEINNNFTKIFHNNLKNNCTTKFHNGLTFYNDFSQQSYTSQKSFTIISHLSIISHNNLSLNNPTIVSHFTIFFHNNLTMTSHRTTISHFTMISSQYIARLRQAMLEKCLILTLCGRRGIWRATTTVTMRPW